MAYRRFRKLHSQVVFVAMLATMVVPADACTVFVMTDGRRVLFCNNEDYSNPNTRIWFIPGTDGRNGCEFVGFDDGWGQGGLNDKGLAFAWVAGFKEHWERRPEMKVVRGNPAQRMLESCATVEEATAFFEQNWEESFSYGKMLVADRRGKSAVIGAKDGQLDMPVLKQSQGIGHRFGLRGHEATRMLGDIARTTLPNAVRVVEATLQEGVHATKYSVIYDLQTCDIYLYRFPEQREPVRFRLSQELEMGPHYYDIPQLEQQLNQELRPLTDEMKKF